MGISFGSIFQSGSKTLIGGTSTGFDTEAIVNTLVEARSVRVNQTQDKIDTNTNKIAAFNELETLLENFRTASNFLRNVPGIGNDEDNTFAYRSAAVTSNTTVAASTYLAVTAEPGASVGPTEVTVQNLAVAKTLVSDTSFADQAASVVEAAGGTTAGMFSAGTITLNALGTDVDIDLEENDSLIDIRAKINAQSATSGVEASILKVANNDFRLILKSTQTGTDFAFTMTDSGNTELDEITFNETIAEDAEFTINNIPVTRSSNTITDVLDGMTFELESETPPGTTLTVNVSADTSLVRDAIISFADAYNALKLFAANQNARDVNGVALEGADLVGNASLRTITSQVLNELTSLVGGLGQDFNDLSDIGISFDNFDGDAENAATQNIMIIDPDALDSALSANFDDVRKIFEFDFSADSSDLVVFKRTNALSITEFTLDIDTVAKTATATFDDNGTPKTINLTYNDSSGTIRLVGQSGTELEGLEMLYVDTVSDSINVTVSQGLADRIYNALNGALAAGTGLIDAEVGTLSTTNTKLEEDIVRLNDQIEAYRQRLLNQFSALENALSRLNSLLDSLEALDLERQAR